MEVVTIKPLSEAQHHFLTQYINLMEAVEEGLELVDFNYQEGYYESGDNLLKELVGVLVPYHSSNMTMRSIFAHDETVLTELDNFQKVVDKAFQIESCILNEKEKADFIHNTFLPTYKKWKKQVYHHLEMYSDD